MKSRAVALITKELLQHWIAFGALAFLLIISYLLFLLGMATSDAASNGFEVLRYFFMSMLAIAAAVLCSRLVVAEYKGKTQLFLEALPMTRIYMVWVKFVLGLTVLLLVSILPFLVTWLMGLRSEGLDLRHLGFLSARLFAYTWFCFSFFFMMGLLGRYRLAIYLLVILLFASLDTMSDFEMGRFGPFSMLDERFATERDLFPWPDFLLTMGLGGAFLVVILLLASIREGNVSALLAEKMSHREKVFIAVLVLGGVFAIQFVDNKRIPDPYDLPDAVLVEGEGIRIKVSPGAGPMGDERAKKLGAMVLGELEDLREFIGYGTDTDWKVFIARRRDLDATRYEPGMLDPSQGQLMRVNYEAADWDDALFMEYLVPDFVDHHSNGRFMIEPKRWIIDGLGHYWIRRDRAEQPMMEDRQMLLRALYATGGSISREDLDRWLAFRDRVGDDLAEAVAWSGLKTIALEKGGEAAQNFLVFEMTQAMEQPMDYRATLRDRAYPLERVLREHAGLELDDWLDRWNRELAEGRAALESDLNRVPRLMGTVRFNESSSATCKLGYRLGLEPAPDAGASMSWTFRYTPIPLINVEISEFDLIDQVHRDATGSWQVLGQDLPRGSRVMVTFSMEDELLDCPIISGWERRTVQP